MGNTFNPSRRKFLKTGLAGTAVLGFAGWWSSPDNKICTDCLWLHEADQAILHALIPVMLASALPEDEKDRQNAITEIIKGFDITVAHFSPAIRAEIRELFWLLSWPVSRALLAGVWSAWSRVKPHSVSNFLNDWRTSRFDLLRVAYTALHDLIMAVWYANPLSWPRINYPGPPKLL